MENKFYFTCGCTALMDCSSEVKRVTNIHKTQLINSGSTGRFSTLFIDIKLEFWKDKDTQKNKTE